MFVRPLDGWISGTLRGFQNYPDCRKEGQAKHTKNIRNHSIPDV